MIVTSFYVPDIIDNEYAWNCDISISPEEKLDKSFKENILSPDLPTNQYVIAQ
jgi:hypothetical protein